MNMYKFGNKICDLREAKDLTQYELGRLLDVSDKTVSKWENGQAIPRMEKFEKLAELLDTTIEELLAVARDNTYIIYLVNDFQMDLHLNIGDNLISIKTEDSCWVEVKSDNFSVTIDFESVNDAIEKEKETSREALARAFVGSSLYAKCTYNFSNVRDGDKIIISTECFSGNNNFIINTNELIFYPKVTGENCNVKLIEVSAKDRNQFIKSNIQIGVQTDLSFLFVGLILTLFLTPIRYFYLRAMSSRKNIYYKISNVEKYLEKYDKDDKKLKLTIISYVILTIIAITVIILKPIIFIEKEKPALVASDYSYIKYSDEVYLPIDKLPENAAPVLSPVFKAEKYESARTNGLTVFEQNKQDNMVKLFEDENGNKYLWLIEDYANNSEVEYEEAKNPYVYVAKQ